MAGRMKTFLEDDCSYCPYFERTSNECGECSVTRGELCGHNVSEDETSPYQCVMSFDAPAWCPLETILEKAVLLPRDRYGDVIRNGTTVRLRHNGGVRTITNMTLASDNVVWMMFSEQGHGGWLMPESQDNVEVV